MWAGGERGVRSGEDGLFPQKRNRFFFSSFFSETELYRQLPHPTPPRPHSSSTPLGVKGEGGSTSLKRTEERKSGKCDSQEEEISPLCLLPVNYFFPSSQFFSSFSSQ